MMSTIETDLGLPTGHAQVGEGSRIEAIGSEAVRPEAPVVEVPPPAKKAATKSHQRQVPWTAEIWRQRNN
jgi:hypothetical protein